MVVKKGLFYRFTKLYKTYKQVEDVFEPPVLHHKFGKWINDPGLPVWRRGAILMIGKPHQYYEEGHHFAAWAGYTKWKEEFLKECSWFGRLWRKFIRPTYQLPIWTAFYFMNSDVMCKIDEDDSAIFEYPPQFTVVLFGLSFSWWLSAPENNADKYHYNQETKQYNAYRIDNDSYWSSVINYSMYRKEKPLKDIILEYIGYSITWNTTPKAKQEIEKLRQERDKFRYDTKEYQEIQDKISSLYLNIACCVCKPEYLKKEYHKDLYEAVEVLKENHPDYFWLYF